MFKFLKEKLKSSILKISRKIEKEGKEEVLETPEIQVSELPSGKTKEPETEIKAEEKPAEKEEIKETQKKFLARIKEKFVTKKINENQFEGLFWNLEAALLENNVAVEVIDKVKYDLKQSIVDKPIKRFQIEKTIEHILKKSIKGMFDIDKINLIEKIKRKKPFVICFVGINGSGKTTTIAKIAKLLTDNKLRCVLAASDTFRAASIEQLQQHADELGIKLIKHDYGADPAAVAFDAIKHAHSKNIDAVLIDTAGRMHSNVNLMDELKKVVRVAKPDLKIFVGEAITGNDCCDQVRLFNEAISVDAIILTKADVDEKGGAMVSVSYISKKPILYLGTGQNYSDLKEFEPEVIINSLGLEA